MSHNWRRLAPDGISPLFWRPLAKLPLWDFWFVWSDVMQTNMRFMYVYILKYFCVCEWRSGLSCMLQQAIAWNGGFPCNLSDWAGLHYNVLHMSQPHRHKIWLFLNWLIFLVCQGRSLIWVCKPVQSVWPTWILDSILALKAICLVIPLVSVPVAVLSGHKSSDMMWNLVQSLQTNNLYYCLAII